VKNITTNGVSLARAVLFAGAGLVNDRSRNIFNGLLRVPVKEKIPALNSI
jgi:hypothetical protein